MALINCPECGKEISDKVKACPHCGFPIVETSDQIFNTNPQPVEVTGIRIKDNKTKKILLISFSIVILFIVGFFAFKFFNEKKAEAEYRVTFNNYIDTLVTLQLKMLNGGSQAEELTNLTKKVWNNSIYQVSDPKTDKFTKGNVLFLDDFNKALDKLYSDQSTINAIDEIKDNQTEVKEIMISLQNPPEGLEDCYKIATDMFTAYKGFTDLAISPEGSLKSYGELLSSRTRDFLDYYDKLNNQIPEKFIIEE